VNVIEALELHAAEGTKRPWRFSEDGEILADLADPSEDEQLSMEVYGGWPVAESMTESDAILATLAVNALPDLLKVARAAKALEDVDCEESPRPACGTCDWCVLRVALEPLFSEVAS